MPTIDTQLENYCSQEIKLETVSDIYQFALEADTTKKNAKAILLDNNSKVLYVIPIEKHNYNLVEVSYIIRLMIGFHAYGIIFIVNCPKGKTKPDRYDYGFRRQLEQATFICGFQLKDYMLINQQGYYSYADERKL